MGNMCSCFHASQSDKAKLIDLRRNILRLVDAPVTAAELMLDEPGHVISPMNDFRLSAMKAEDSLTGGRSYILIPISRVNGKLSESEMAVIESFFGKREVKRRSSVVIPVVPEISGDCAADIGILNQYRMRHWEPALEPICEGK
ncbi:hypothetical protein OROHE_025628 [Orobanche hederae]